MHVGFSLATETWISFHHLGLSGSQQFNCISVLNLFIFKTNKKKDFMVLLAHKRSVKKILTNKYLSAALE